MTNLNDLKYEIYVSTAGTDEAWDNFVNKTPFGHHVQTSRWSRLKAADNWQPLRVIALQDGQIIAGLQLLLKRISIFGMVGYASNGPVFAYDTVELREKFLKELHQVIKQHRVRLLFLQPAIGEASFVQVLAQSGYKLSTETIAPLATVLIDLHQDLDSIHSQFKKSKRRSIRYAERNGVCIREGDSTDVALFHKLLCATSQRQGFDTHSLEYYQKVYDLFEPGRHVKLLFAEHENQAVSSMLLIGCSDTVISKKAGWSGEKGNLRPNEALEWGAIQWAKARGYRYYDLEGIDREVAETVLRDNETPEFALETPAHYKLSYGGQVRLLPQTYSYSPNPLIDWLYHTVYPEIRHLAVFNAVMRAIRGHGVKKVSFFGILHNFSHESQRMVRSDTFGSIEGADGNLFVQAYHMLQEMIHVSIPSAGQYAFALAEHLPI